MESRKKYEKTREVSSWRRFGEEEGEKFLKKKGGLADGGIQNSSIPKQPLIAGANFDLNG